MIKDRSADRIYFEDVPDFDKDDRDVQFCVRPADVLQNPEQWEKQKGLLDRYPRDEMVIFHGGHPVAEVKKGGSIIVNCEEVSDEVAVVLAGNMRSRPSSAVKNVDLGRWAEVMARFEQDIFSTLSSYLKHSYWLTDFLSGQRSIELGFPDAMCDL